jgi:hypothetical protein
MPIILRYGLIVLLFAVVAIGSFAVTRAVRDGREQQVRPRVGGLGAPAITDLPSHSPAAGVKVEATSSPKSGSDGESPTPAPEGSDQDLQPVEEPTPTPTPDPKPTPESKENPLIING